MTKKIARAAQLDGIEVTDDDIVLNVGCGTDTQGIGIDLNYGSADIRADLNQGLPIQSDSVDHIIAEHVLEHLENPAETLREFRRVLKRDGTLEIEVPNAGWLPIRLYITQDIQRFWEHKIPGTKGHWLARWLGHPDPDRTAHLTLWTKRLLANHLSRAGFKFEFVDTHHWSRNLRVTVWLPDEP